MLGPKTSDEFPKFGGYRPPVGRSEIETFTHEDANFVLDGDGTPGGHDYHRYGTDVKDSEFPAGWNEPDVIDLVNCIVDAPTDAMADDDLDISFVLYGSHRGVDAVVRVREEYGLGWRISATYPLVRVDWMRARERMGE